MIAVKVQYFQSPRQLADFCADVANGVTAVISASQDNSGAWVLLYTV